MDIFTFSLPEEIERGSGVNSHLVSILFSSLNGKFKVSDCSSLFLCKTVSPRKNLEASPLLLSKEIFGNFLTVLWNG